MTSAYIAVSYDCNHKCICCPLTTYNRMHEAMDYDVIHRQLVNLKLIDDDDVHVIVSGGEPTLYSGFFDIVSLLSERRYGITVLSNGSTCSDKTFVDRLIKCVGVNLDRTVFVSAIHSMKADIHDAITGVPGSLDQTLTGLHNLLYAGINISIKHIISGLSYRDMKETFVFLDESFPEKVSFDICSMDFSGRGRKNVDKLFVSFGEVKPYLESVLDIWDPNKPINGRKVSLFELPLCAVDPYYWSFFKRSDSKINKYIAPVMGIGQGIETVSECTTNYKECETCDVKKYCDGVWYSAYSYAKNNDIPNLVSNIKQLQ